MSETVRKPNLVLGLIGAAIGGAVGYFILFWMLKKGYYALVLPPSLMGLAAGFCARGRSVLLAILCGIAGLSLALFIEWKLSAFEVDRSLFYFLTHVHRVNQVDLIVLIVGPILGFRLALGFDQKSAK